MPDAVGDGWAMFDDVGKTREFCERCRNFWLYREIDGFVRSKSRVFRNDFDQHHEATTTDVKGMKIV